MSHVMGKMAEEEREEKLTSGALGVMRGMD